MTPSSDVSPAGVPSTRKVEGSRSAFTDWFWRPPPPHGATIPYRIVTNLELFYDLG